MNHLLYNLVICWLILNEIIFIALTEKALAETAERA